jgi:hypothetical protein
MSNPTKWWEKVVEAFNGVEVVAIAFINQLRSICELPEDETARKAAVDTAFDQQSGFGDKALRVGTMKLSMGVITAFCGGKALDIDGEYAFYRELLSSDDWKETTYAEWNPPV